MKTPFGNTTAAVKLAKMVEDNKKFRRIVSGYFGTYLKMLNSLSDIRNIISKRKALLIFRDYYIRSVKNDIMLPYEIKTHLLNVMVAYHRTAQKAIRS